MAESHEKSYAFNLNISAKAIQRLLKKSKETQFLLN
jgi:hypothetical protein